LPPDAAWWRSGLPDRDSGGGAAAAAACRRREEVWAREVGARQDAGVVWMLDRVWEREREREKGK